MNDIKIFAIIKESTDFIDDILGNPKTYAFCYNLAWDMNKVPINDFIEKVHILCKNIDREKKDV